MKELPATVYRRPVDAWVAGFIGEANPLPGHAESATAVPGSTHVAVGDSVPIHCSGPAHHWPSAIVPAHPDPTYQEMEH
ncbi:hypothetical protein [Nonomuraea endophytica]|uniref:ABC-type Fe3+/spermidine/putrescine transport system ATPase subunit n=1 Tax=Nonomuraea endophytica TaxID=714136 RepID=A0A7W8A961_9ACTN|nr:hypothetical protein [Nonomuraea endophytica]MBB5081929.1 ABC-type Fe3+/spermidine/putrescine transport system ATPase subunit [Nonomuraea endophytica]